MEEKKIRPWPKEKEQNLFLDDISVF